MDTTVGKLALVIGASNESVFAINVAKQLGMQVYAFDGNSSAEGLKFADKFFVVDIKNYKNIINALDGLKPDLVLPVPIGRWLTTTGEINDYYNLRGISAEACKKCVDKYYFHQLLNKETLRNINCLLLKDKQIQVPSFFPAVVKPRFGSGSRDVFIVRNELEFNDKISMIDLKNEEFICEEFINGQEYGIDGAVVDGKLYIVLIRKKENTMFPYRQCIGYYSVIPENNIELFDRVKSYIQKIVTCLCLNNTLFHADIIDNGENTYVIELSPRPSGHNLHNDFTKITTSVDMVLEFIKNVFGVNKKENFLVNNTKTTLISYFNFENCIITKIPNKEYLMNKYPLKRYVCNIKNQDYMQVVKDGKTLMQRGYYILESDNEILLKQYRDNLLNEFGRAYEK